MSKLDIVKAIIAAWSNKDVEAVLELITEDIVFFYAIGRAPARGKVEMRALLEQLKGHQSDLNWQIKNAAETGNVVMIEAVDQYTNPSGIIVQTPHMTTFEFDGDLICGWRDYFDFSQLMRLEQGEAPDPNIMALIDR